MTRTAARPSLFGRVGRGALITAACFYLWVLASLAVLKILPPPATAVQLQRRVESWFHKTPYRRQSAFVRLRRISPHLQHAVIAAEDARFFSHRGFDWDQFQQAVEEDLESRRLRGGSTITQQLVKNLFLTTRGGLLRKSVEFTLVPAAELILGKRRILELYLNVIEWGDGVYGAEAAARRYYGVPAARIGREEAARLAAILPDPRRRDPARMRRYSRIILERMAAVGW